MVPVDDWLVASHHTEPRGRMTKRSKRVLPLIACLIGLVGVVICLAGFAAVWSLGARLMRTNDKVFAGVERALTAGRERIQDAQERVQESRITTADIGTAMKQWTRAETSERVAARLEVQEKTEVLLRALGQTGAWLEMSEASLQGLLPALELGISMGAPVNTAVLDASLEQLAAMRAACEEAADTVRRIRDRTEPHTTVETGDAVREQAAELALRVAATLGNVDGLLGDAAEGLSAAEQEARQWKSNTESWIALATAGAVLLIGWMGAGQASLCLHGWKGWRRRRGRFRPSAQ